MQNRDEKRLFFGLGVLAPWPEHLPAGRIIEEKDRHSTLAFLGQADYQKIVEILPLFPEPPFKMALSGVLDQCLFLPRSRYPRVVAWHVKWLNEENELIKYQENLIEFLQSHDLKPDVKRIFLPHVTLARPPFRQDEWKHAFQKLPCMTNGIHLYESLGHSQYQIIWTYPLSLPFEEFEHTADIAFHIRGENLEQISQHAFLALAFKFPSLLSFMPTTIKEIRDLNDTVILLNDVVGLADAAFGCPFKAVSFHGDLKQEEDHTLHWEMIVDV
jgi:2'-5' RNA ligase